ncbi:MAG TPA: hypothetical protein VKR58_14740 [Aquella sp.]|nr:hypothetical protein [Aquella sp.]
MAFTLLDNQKVPVSVSFADAAGNPATLPAGVIPVWTSDTPATCTVDASADPTGLTAVVTAVGPLGNANIIATTTIGTNAPIVATAAVTVAASGPASASITFGTPVGK